jgi:tRNA nucleotidyltransferase/poly(A) polymerase
MVSSFTMEVSDGVAAALDIARRAGNPLIVGGAVRDAALGADPKDIDIEVHGTDIERLAQRYRDEGYRVDEVGKQFGVLKVSKKGVVTDLDVAVPRRENKVSAGHRGFEVSHDRDMTVTDAAERRDYTINAILYDPKHQVIVDPFGGSDDLKAGVLRHVSDKFAEDPLRVLRGVQMAGRFGMEIHPDTAAVCRELRPAFDELATERVQEEWSKLYTKSTRPDLAIKALQDAGWDDTLPGLRTALANPDVVSSLTRLPEVDVADRTVLGAALLSRTMSEPDRAVFLHNTVIGKDTQHVAADLVTADPAQLDNSYSRKVHAYVLAKRDFTFDRYLTYAEMVGDEKAVQVARAAVAEGIGAGPEQPMIQGRDVIAAVAGARKPGPWIGELVDEARDRQYRGEFTDRDAALAWVAGQVSGS